jgi:hypothetical protein
MRNVVSFPSNFARNGTIYRVGGTSMTDTIDAIDAARRNAANSAAEYKPMSAHTTAAVENLRLKQLQEAARTPPVQPATVTPDDLAVLSLTARGKLLQQEGRSVGEIADQLGLTTNAVQRDLGITVTSAQQATAKAS